MKIECRPGVRGGQNFRKDFRSLQVTGICDILEFNSLISTGVSGTDSFI
jgi:hypothetical protein